MPKSQHVVRVRCGLCEAYGYTKDDPLFTHIHLYTADGAAKHLREQRIRKSPHKHGVDQCDEPMCVHCAERRARLAAPDRSIKVTHVAEIPKQRQRAFVETPSGDLVSLIKRGLTNLGVKVVLCAALISCGAQRPSKLVTVDTACDRAEQCGVLFASRDACEFCVECLVKVNGEQLKSVLVDAQSIACPTAVKWWDELLSRCASEWVPGSRCGNSKGEEIK